MINANQSSQNLNLPNYIKEEIDNLIQEIFYQENETEENFKRSKDAVETLEKIINKIVDLQKKLSELQEKSGKNSKEGIEIKKENNDSPEKNIEIERKIKNIEQEINTELNKLRNNFLIKKNHFHLLNHNKLLLSNEFQKKTIEEKNQIIKEIINSENQSLSKINQGDLKKIKKSDSKIEKIKKTLTLKFKKIPDFIKNKNLYSKNQNNSKNISKNFFLNEEETEIQQLLRFYIQPSQLFDKFKSENCTHLDIRNYILDKLKNELNTELNIKKITFENDNENLKEIVIENLSNESSLEDQIIIDEIIAKLSQRNIQIDANFINKIFFNWSKIFPDTGFSTIKNLMYKACDKVYPINNIIDDINNQNLSNFINFLYSQEFEGICNSLDSQFGVCQTRHNKVTQKNIENHNCQEDGCKIEKEIDSFYQNDLILNEENFIKNYDNKKNIFYKQIGLKILNDHLAEHNDLFVYFQLFPKESPETNLCSESGIKRIKNFVEQNNDIKNSLSFLNSLNIFSKKEANSILEFITEGLFLAYIINDLEVIRKTKIFSEHFKKINPLLKYYKLNFQKLFKECKELKTQNPNELKEKISEKISEHLKIEDFKESKKKLKLSSHLYKNSFIYFAASVYIFLLFTITFFLNKIKIIFFNLFYKAICRVNKLQIDFLEKIKLTNSHLSSLIGILIFMIKIIFIFEIVSFFINLNKYLNIIIDISSIQISFKERTQKNNEDNKAKISLLFFFISVCFFLINFVYSIKSEVLLIRSFFNFIFNSNSNFDLLEIKELIIDKIDLARYSAYIFCALMILDLVFLINDVINFCKEKFTSHDGCIDKISSEFSLIFSEETNQNLSEVII